MTSRIDEIRKSLESRGKSDMAYAKWESSAALHIKYLLPIAEAAENVHAMLEAHDIETISWIRAEWIKDTLGSALNPKPGYDGVSNDKQD